MTELLTAAQMRAIEQAAISSGEVTGLELMERAGRGVVEAIFEEWPELQKAPHRAVVLCGPGNNGGDGFVVARLLKEWGWEVEVFLYGDPDKLPPDARVNYERWGKLGEVAELDGVAVEHATADVFVDAIFGTGLSRELRGQPSSVANFLRQRRWRKSCHVVAIDFPSGICSDSGRVLRGAGPADLTVCFEREKVGHRLAEGPGYCGKVVVKPIGLQGRPRKPDPAYFPERERWLADGSVPDVGAYLNHTPHHSYDLYLLDKHVHKFGDHHRETLGQHKYTHGHALILSGGPGKTGAARLAARGALRIGAGLVTLACPQQALWEVATHVTAIMCHPLDGAPGLAELLEDERLNALCLGPGMGLGADTQHLVMAALKANRATVLDADALTRFERDPQVLFDALHENCVLTPHAGEFKRLFPDIAEKLAAPATKGPAYSKVDATREAAARAGCTVLYKGPDTVIADPAGRCAINSSAYDRAAPWLATAGAGDVLAGFITGLLARGFGPMQAAETAAWLHTECALSFGPGLIAEDLPEELPKVFRQLGL